MITHIESNASAAITGDRRVRRCTWSAPRPTFPRLDAWTLIGRWNAMIDLIGCVALKTRMRPVFSIPVGKQARLLAEGLATKWYQDNACTFILERQDESLNQGNATVLANGAEAWCDPLAITPILEPVAPELRPLVANDVLGRGTGVVDGAFEEALNRQRRGIVLEDGNAHDTSGIVVDDHRHPPAERPALR